MSSKQLKRDRVLHEAVLALWIEPLEERRLLTSCSGTDPMVVLGNDSVDNRITISYDSGNQTVSVTDSAASVTGNCTNQTVSGIKG